MSTLKPQPPSNHQKLGGRQFFEAMGSPKYVVAPMVDQSELAWRVLSRLHGATIAYTPMFHAALFSDPAHTRYKAEAFDTSPTSLEGVAPYDRPLIVQFCANDKDIWLAAAKLVQGRCDAVDLNLGCPQGIAKKGKYGAFLMEEWELIGDMISHLHKNLTIPVTAKMRIFPSVERTLEYASHLFSSGAQLLSVHGRTREAKGQFAGLASWPKISTVREALGAIVPIYANGGVPSSEEIAGCLEETGADGIMSAEGNLYNPLIFSPQNAQFGREYFAILPPTMQAALTACNDQLIGTSALNPAYAPATFIASQYLAIVRTLPSTETSLSAVKSHLFKLFRPIWAAEKHHDLREELGKCGGGKKASFVERVQRYQELVDLMHQRIQSDLADGSLPPNSHRLLTHEEVVQEFGGIIPYSHSQPYLRIDTPVTVDEVPAVTASVENGIAPTENELKRSREEVDVTEPPVASTSQLPPLHDDSAESSTKRPKVSTDETPVLPRPTPSVCPGSSSTLPCRNAPGAKCSLGACKTCCEGILKENKDLATVSADSGAGKDVDGVEGMVVEAGSVVESCAFHDARAEKQSAKSALKKERRTKKQAGRAQQRKEKFGGQENEFAATAT